MRSYSAGDLATKRQFELLRQYVFGLLTGMVNEIAAGHIAPNPYTRGKDFGVCTYCPYGSICNKAQVADRREYKSTKAQQFWEDVEREVESRG